MQSCAGWAKNKDYHPFNPEGLNKLTSGKSTANQVTKILGAPSEIVTLSNGNAYIYRRSLSKGTGLWLLIVSFGNYEKRYDRIVIFFDKKNIMTHYGVTLDAHKAAYELPFNISPLLDLPFYRGQPGYRMCILQGHKGGGRKPNF